MEGSEGTLDGFWKHRTEVTEVMSIGYIRREGASLFKNFWGLCNWR